MGILKDLPVISDFGDLPQTFLRVKVVELILIDFSTLYDLNALPAETLEHLLSVGVLELHAL